ncbi:MAG: carbon-nitrogen hydrolase [Phycisphaeraceae bacterium]
MADDQTLTLGLIQHAAPGLDAAAKAANVDKCCAMIREAAGRGAQLAVTQELFASAYFPQVEDEARFDLAEPVPGPTTRRLAALADELGIEIAASLFERRAAGVYHNTSVLLRPGAGVAGRYRKMHIPDDPRFYEKYYFTPGDLGFQAWPTEHGTLGPLVCWDQWFPEAARLTAMRGAELLMYPTAIGWHDSETQADRAAQQDAWRTVQRSHAISNGVYVAAVNRVGREGELTFWGSSFVVEPGGRVIAEASGDADEVVIATCELRRIESARRGWPFLRDRRIDAYGGLTARLGDEG